MLPVRYELDFYILFRRNSVFKGLMNNEFERMWKKGVGG
jgi:hypothetical protein